MPSSSGICISFCFISVIVVSFNTKMKTYGVFQAGTIIFCTRRDTHAVIPVGPAPRWWLSWQSDSIFCCCWHCGFSSSVILPLKCTGIRTARQSSSSESPFRFPGHLAFGTGKPMTLCKEMLSPRQWLKTCSVSISYERKLGLYLCIRHKFHSDFIFSFA